ncbi:sensor domain-containing protein [Ectobacillus ponti]|uniref:EAL domain-containing protein n=1 Tax=Ectobacillus ponti TaxID=2961894 RepID=A0AA41XCN1_9BACI|nr:EAL domain-containing protein [Ectobacillus ponti]MCP8970470.1 EAL domain-containing protein [Ectobacillus ponti]
MVAWSATNVMLLIGILALSSFSFYLYIKKRFYERSAQIANEHCDSLFVHHPDGLVVYKNHETVLNMNSLMEEITGYSLTELQHMEWECLAHPQYRDLVRRQLRQAMQGSVREYYIVLVAKTGEHKKVLIRHIPVYIGTELHAMYSTVRDVTGQIQTAEKTQAFFTNSVDAMEILDLEGKVLQVNRAYETLFEWKQEEVQGLFPPHLPVHWRAGMGLQVLERVQNGEVLKDLEILAQSKSGQTIPTRATLSPIYSEYGTIHMISVVIRDVSDQKEMEQVIEESQQMYHLLAQYTSDSIVVIKQPEAKLVYVSPIFEEMFQLKATDTNLYSSFVQFIHPDDIASVLTGAEMLYREKRVVCLECRRKDSKKHWNWVETRGVPIFGDDGEIRFVIWSVQDIQERKDYELQLENLAFRDFLTGAANRASFEAYAAKLIGDNQPFYLCHLDTDNFKSINDQYSHQAGDALLIETVKRVQRVLQPDEFLARVGGDEFVIISPGRNEEDIKQLTSVLIEKFSQPFTYKDNEIYSTLSIGVVSFPERKGNLERLMKKVDKALYYAKTNGKNQVSFYGEMHERALTIEESLPKAIRNEELYLVFQPLLHLENNVVYGIEALLRWKHPVLGEVSPLEFIPVAERNHWIYDITLWVIQEATKQLYKWDQLGLRNAKLFINFSPYLLRQTDLVEAVPAILTKNQVSSQRLVLEITETGVIENLSTGLNILQKFQEVGIQIAMDDFGTGFSSLSYIRHLPISILKIDRSFIKEIDQQPKDSMIVESIVELAKSLGLQVVAEGIETEKQECILTEFGDVVGQGYHFSRPLTSEHIEEWLKHKI